jgi:thiol-disulfide isomerase/thioredoxin
VTFPLARAAALAALCFGLASAHAESLLNPWKGGRTPALSGETLEGGRIDLADLRGKVVLVNFWASWCEPCRDEMPSIERLRGRFPGRGFEVIAVNFGETRTKVTDFTARHSMKLPVVLDPDKKIAGDWRVRGLPMSFLIGSDGRIRYWLFGEMDWSGEEAVRAVEGMLSAGARHGRS